MIILVIKTDTILAEVSLWQDSNQLIIEKWEAHRQLADTIHIKIQKLLGSQNLTWADIEGLLVYRGPGSFTGLRIGMSVANAIAYTLGSKIIAETGDNWKALGIERLLAGESDKVALPEYGAEANITLPKK